MADCFIMRKATIKGSDSTEYITNGLLKSFVMNNFDESENVLIKNISNIVVSEGMTVECCCMYTGFSDNNAVNKGRIFIFETNYEMIGMSMYNNILEAAMSTNTSTGWAADGKTGITVEPNEFVTLAMTSDTNGTKFYKNGTVCGNYANNVASRVGDILDVLGVKCDCKRTDRNLIGTVYMIRIYNRVLTKDELMQNVYSDIQNYRQTAG